MIKKYLNTSYNTLKAELEYIHCFWANLVNEVDLFIFFKVENSFSNLQNLFEFREICLLILFQKNVSFSL